MEGKYVFIVEINVIKATNFYEVGLKFKKKRDFGLNQALLYVRNENFESLKKVNMKITRHKAIIALSLLLSL